MAAHPQPSNPLEARLEKAFLAKYVAARRAGKNYRAVADALHISVTEVIEHAKKFRWKQRFDDIAKRSADMLADRVAESLADVDERHLRGVRQVQERLMAGLENAVFDDPAKAAAMMDKMVKLERQILQLDGADKDTDDLPTRIAKKLQQLTGKKEQPHLVDPDDYTFDSDLAANPPDLDDCAESDPRAE